MDGKEDNKDIVLLNPKLFIGVVELATLDEDILTRVRAKVGLLDESIMKGLATASSEWERDGGLIYREGCICVPRDENLRGNIIRSHHDTPIAGHPGQFKMHELITRNYWWPGLQWDVNRYITGCKTCQWTKAQ